MLGRKIDRIERAFYDLMDHPKRVLASRIEMPGSETARLIASPFMPKFWAASAAPLQCHYGALIDWC